MILWLIGCGFTAAPQPPPAQGVPRSTDAAKARLVAVHADCDRCEGGSLGDEVSYECFGTWQGKSFSLDAVTTGTALPMPATGAGAMVEDLWVEVHVQRDDEGSRRLLAMWAGTP